MRFKIYYREEDDGLVLSLGQMNVMSPRQIYDPKLVPFSLIIYII
jgi:hypothetical protein